MNRTLIAGLTVLALFSLPASGKGEFPEQNITFIVPFSPGGGFDAIARAIGRSMKKFLPEGVNIIVKNVTGAGGVTGTVALYRARPDGYTIGHMYVDGMFGLQILRGVDRAGYDITKFTWLARVGGEPFAVLVRKESPYRSLKDLQQAKRVTFGVEGIGVTRWFAAFIAANELKIPFDVVAGYGGTGESQPALLRGDFDVFMQPIDHPSTLPYIKTGEIRPIVNLDESRAKGAPDVPTAKELGYDVIIKVGRAIGAPPGLAPDKARVLEDLLLKSMSDSDYKSWVEKSGQQIVPADAAQANADVERYAKSFNKYKSAMLKAVNK